MHRMLNFPRRRSPRRSPGDKKQKGCQSTAPITRCFYCRKLERAMRFELTTSTLATGKLPCFPVRWHSTWLLRIATEYDVGCLRYCELWECDLVERREIQWNAGEAGNCNRGGNRARPPGYSCTRNRTCLQIHGRHRPAPSPRCSSRRDIWQR